MLKDSTVDRRLMDTKYPVPEVMLHRDLEDFQKADTS